MNSALTCSNFDFAIRTISSTVVKPRLRTRMQISNDPIRTTGTVTFDRIQVIPSVNIDPGNKMEISSPSSVNCLMTGATMDRVVWYPTETRSNVDVCYIHRIIIMFLVGV